MAKVTSFFNYVLFYMKWILIAVIVIFLVQLEDARSSSELSECESSVEDQKLKCSPFNLRN